MLKMSDNGYSVAKAEYDEFVHQRCGSEHCPVCVRGAVQDGQGAAQPSVAAGAVRLATGGGADPAGVLGARHPARSAPRAGATWPPPAGHHLDHGGVAAPDVAEVDLDALVVVEPHLHLEERAHAAWSRHPLPLTAAELDEMELRATDHNLIRQAVWRMARLAEEARLLVHLVEHDPERWGPALRSLLDRLAASNGAAQTVLGCELGRW